MKIAMVCYPTFGGSGFVATELALGLADLGHQVHVVSYEMPVRLERWRQNIVFHHVEVAEYPLFRHQPYMLNLTNKLIELVEVHGIEIIHSHYAIPHAQAAWMAREVVRERGFDVRLACTLHGTDITLVGRSPGFEEITRFAIHKQDVLTAPSRWLAEETAKSFGVDVSAIQVIPNFIDPQRFRPADKPSMRSCLAPNGEYVLSHASNFRPVKRVEDVVRAFAIVRKSLPAVLALAGEGPELGKAERLARELGVATDLRVLGNQDRIETLLQASDLFLLPSMSESFGLAALEALACGCPVLGYASGGLPEVVEDGVSGILCDPEEDQCLGQVAEALLRDSTRHLAMKRAARQQALGFAPKAILDNYLCALSFT